MNRIRTEYQMQVLMEAAQLRIEAAKLPRGSERDTLLQRIEKLEQTATIEGWINSPGLRCPKENSNGKAHH